MKLLVNGMAVSSWRSVLDKFIVVKWKKFELKQKYTEYAQKRYLQAENILI